MRRFASTLAATAGICLALTAQPPPADAGVLSTAGHVLTTAGGAILSAGKWAACKGLGAAGTVAQGATTVGGAALGGAETGGAGAAAGGAAGGAVGGVLKKGVGVVKNAVCSSAGGGGVASTLAKAAVGAAAAGAIFDLAAHWMIGAAAKVTGAVVAVITHASSPQLTAAWFSRSFTPMLALGAALALLVTLISLTSAALRRNPAALAATLAGILRAGLGSGLLIALTTVALQVSDAISADVIRTSHQTFWSQVGHVWGGSGFGGFGSSALAMLMAIVQVFAGLIVWLELAVRNAAIYLAVLFFPVALAASIWPALAGWTSRLARLLFLFVILKPVTLIVLAFAGNAALAGLSLNGNLASSAGTIIAAITIFALAAMAPWVLMLIVGADAESAAIGAGFRAAAGHAASDGASRLGRLGGRVRGAARGTGGRSGGGGPARSAGSGGRGGGPGGSGGPSAGGGGGSGLQDGPAPSTPTAGGASASSASAPASGGTRRPARAAQGAPGSLSAPGVGAVALAAGLASPAPARNGDGGGSKQGPATSAPGEVGGATRTPIPSQSRQANRRANASESAASAASAPERPQRREAPRPAKPAAVLPFSPRPSRRPARSA